MEKNSINRTIKIYGKTIDTNTRCVHYHSTQDIIAIKFKCCNKYYPCYSCHQESERHEATPWPKEDFSKPAIYCGACKNELTIACYLNNTYHCPVCRAKFNPNCELHHDLYFKKGK
ncbi:hypothetical protein CIB95_06915 [Lottiidibacillus patelloidae]|uniref:CHY-type domain-containing protein n=1 Tax=Lottiidibacillus patelloidae TaxID=2670334 RepID=A0A263BTZ8_9BACI|nr:CHY zinc finger protein [Lottiidibacillus patelloidae]OZM57190.1 hypothetical protein CIB95_06915 [Lottiidibacillus patelloidae]